MCEASEKIHKHTQTDKQTHTYSSIRISNACKILGVHKKGGKPLLFSGHFEPVCVYLFLCLLRLTNVLDHPVHKKRRTHLNPNWLNFLGMFIFSSFCLPYSCQDFLPPPPPATTPPPPTTPPGAPTGGGGPPAAMLLKRSPWGTGYVSKGGAWAETNTVSESGMEEKLGSVWGVSTHTRVVEIRYHSSSGFG